MKMIRPDVDDTLVLPLNGKTITTAVFDRNDTGYDRLTLIFDDGSKLVVLEQGQSGHFAVAY